MHWTLWKIVQNIPWIIHYPAMKSLKWNLLPWMLNRSRHYIAPWLYNQQSKKKSWTSHKLTHYIISRSPVNFVCLHVPPVKDKNRIHKGPRLGYLKLLKQLTVNAYQWKNLSFFVWDKNILTPGKYSMNIRIWRFVCCVPKYSTILSCWRFFRRSISASSALTSWNIDSNDVNNGFSTTGEWVTYIHLVIIF